MLWSPKIAILYNMTRKLEIVGMGETGILIAVIVELGEL